MQGYGPRARPRERSLRGPGRHFELCKINYSKIVIANKFHYSRTVISLVTYEVYLKVNV